MAITKKPRPVDIEQRRTAVARLKAQHLTTREIADRLTAEGFTHPDGSPYSHMAVVRDLAILRKAWAQQAVEDTRVLCGALLNEIREVRRQAWAQGDLDVVLKAIKSERDLLGLDAPTKIHLESDMRQRVEQLARASGMDAEELWLEFLTSLSAVAGGKVVMH